MRRRLLILAVFLLAGAVVNVAVAWGCAVWIPTSAIQLGERRGLIRKLEAEGFWRYWEITRSERSGELSYYCYWNTRSKRFFSEKSTYLSPAELASSWASLRTRPATDSGTRYVRALGWPVVSMWYDYGGGDGYIMSELLHGLPVTFLRSHGAFPQAVPLNPIWPAFAVNTVFYAAALCLLICGPFVLRRFIRARRGLCPACAYPRGESDACSECGRELAT